MSATQLTITVGTDGSPLATRAVEWAADEASRRELPLIIVHVIEDFGFDIPMTTAPGMRESRLESGHEMLATAQKVARERHPELDVTARLDGGSTALRLRELSNGANTMVLGHRGLGGFAALLLGSTGLRVAGYASGPVVIVRGESVAQRGEIVVGLEPFEDNDAMLTYAFEAARSHRARLRFVHCSPVAQLLTEAGRVSEAEDVERGQKTRMSELLEPWKERFPDVKVTEQIVREHPVVALENASRDADLLIVSAYGHTAAQAMFLGSVSHGVIHHAHCPVAIIRPHV